jgi:PAS domain S-box-containing protein
MRRLWDVLTRPSPTIVEAEGRRRARMLAAILIVVVPISVAAAWVIPALGNPGSSPWENRQTVTGALSGVAGFVAYALSRTRLHALGAYLTVLTAVAAAWLGAFVNAATASVVPSLYFLGIGVLLSATLLPWWFTVSVAGVNHVFLLAAPELLPGISYFDVANPFLFLFLLSSFLVVFAAVRHQDLMQIQSQARQLVREEERWRSVAEHAPDIILTIDRGGRILFVNHPVPGLTVEQVVGSRFDAYVPEEERPRLWRYLHTVFRTGKPQAFEMPGMGPDGTQAWYSTRLGPITRDGRVQAAVMITADITEIRKAADARQESREREKEVESLKALADFKSNFMNMAAHELNTPLTPIKLQLHLLAKKVRNGSVRDAQQALRVLDRNVRRMETLLKDVLDGARIESGHLELRPGRVDLAEAARDVVELHCDMARDFGVDLEAEPHGPVEANVDADRIAQVFYNLIGNAIKYTPSGGRVRVRALRRGNEAVVEVSDTGRGLSREQMERLFQPFSQVHTDFRPEVPGTGLGLYICRGLVRRHGGRIWCESDGPGQGSTFAFAVPLAWPHQETPEESGSAEAPHRQAEDARVPSA